MLAAPFSARAQFFFEQDTPANYWMQERQRQDFFFERSRPQRPPVTRRASKPKPARAAEKAPEPEITDPNDPRPRIVILGDDLGSDLLDGLKTLNPERTTFRLLRRTKDNSGLIRDEGQDWPKITRDLLEAKEAPAMGVILIGMNDRQAIRDGKNSFELRSPRWNELYIARARAIAEVFRDKKIPLVWVGLPIVANEKAAADLNQMNDLFKHVARETGASFVDVWEVFADERGHFAAYGPDVNGQMLRLRTSDGIHFTTAGAKKLAHFVEAEIARLMGDAPKPIAVAPPPPVAKQAPRPTAGPVMPLTAAPTSPGGALLKAQETSLTPEIENTIARGLPLTPKRGRMDDFTWDPR